MHSARDTALAFVTHAWADDGRATLMFAAVEDTPPVMAITVDGNSFSPRGHHTNDRRIFGGCNHFGECFFGDYYYGSFFNNFNHRLRKRG